MREVTDTTFDAEVLAAPGPTIVDFWAPWCKPCKAIEPLLEGIAADRGVALVRLNIDEHLAVPGRYGVLSLPTVILFAEGHRRRRPPARPLRACVRGLAAGRIADPRIRATAGRPYSWVL